MNAKGLTGWQVGLFLLALIASVFHLWIAETMRFSSPIGEYFGIAGVLFLLGGVLALVGGLGFLFKLGAGGLVALSAIDNALLYYTRTFGLGFVFRLFPSSRPFAVQRLNGTFSSRTFNGTISPHFSGALHRPSFGAGAPWSTSWIPPGAVQFFALQTVIIIVTIVALWRVSRKASTATPGSDLPQR